MKWWQALVTNPSCTINIWKLYIKLHCPCPLAYLHTSNGVVANIIIVGGLNLKKTPWLFKLFYKHHFWTRVRYDHQLPISRGSQAGLPLCRPFWINPRWRPSRVSHDNNLTTNSRTNMCKTIFRGFSGTGNSFFVLLFRFYLNVTL